MSELYRNVGDCGQGLNQRLLRCLANLTVSSIDSEQQMEIIEAVSNFAFYLPEDALGK